ncbi:HNH endonuclease [Janthinobacterium sp. FW305-128]|uniref:HNH endonuclease n=1 Tax=Janthinobacterium sp. FW305-128 TaxID=2775055 RepID=UPI001E5654E2|nr:HNH endonuclease [Janthinobacterium sp. FW305-128]
MSHSGFDSHMPDTCIYCSRPGPFTDEHVFCAGLGGDDNTFLLRELVCKKCNEETFSPLEAAFLRASPEAIGRAFLQTHGRKRSGKARATEAPLLQCTTTSVLLPDSDEPVEAVFGRGGVVSILPKFILTGNNMGSRAATSEDLAVFCHELISYLSADELVAIRKEHASGGASFVVTTYIFSCDKYIESSSSVLRKAPKTGFWIECSGGELEPEEMRRTELVRNSNGHTVVRLKNEGELSGLLGRLRKNIFVFEQIAGKKVDGDTVVNPLVSISVQSNLDARSRVLAKIGINLCAFVMGKNFVCKEGFSDMKKKILLGQEEIALQNILLDEQSAEFLKIFDLVQKSKHFVSIMLVPMQSGTNKLSMFMRIFGGAFIHIVLAENLPHQPNFPIFLEVDYNLHQLEIFNLAEFSSKYSSAVMSKMHSERGRRQN